MDKPQNVSSSTTLFLKFALPISWIIFFGSLTGALWLNDIGPVMGIPLATFRIVFTLFFLTGVGLLYWMVIRLKRVEMSRQFLYVTNYFKNVRYPFSQVKKLEEKDYFFFKSIVIHFKEPGYFGKKVTFIPSRTSFDRFLAEHPEVVKQLPSD